jgi:hypothetical protein
MTSNWALPTTVIQYAETDAEDHHVSWVDVDNFNAIKNLDSGFIKTSRDLIHIAKQPRHDLTEKTYFLKVTGFNFINLPDTVSGIECKLHMQRSGRISDETIQLCLDNDIIGDNQSSFKLDPIHIYGNETDIWNAKLTITDVQKSTFGVVLRFRSHPDWPHKSTALIGAVELRVH